ncbi:MAG: hypothetical protein IKX65_09630 [Prevotella sp.]|nr:hypothetical protein [Prevotella sp.]
MYIKDVPKLREKLVQNGVSYDNIEFIINQIKDSKLDEDFKIIHQSTYKLMLEKDLWDTFEKVCNDLGIIITRRNEPES